jgi:hypothetical protein
MNKLSKYAFSLLGCVGLLSLLSPSVQARPYPDRSGICYFFRGEKPELKRNCILETGYGAGAHYASLNWQDGIKTAIEMINICPQGGFDNSGFCRYTVDGHAAQPYERNVFLQPTQEISADNLYCYRVVKTGNSVCYRFQ